MNATTSTTLGTGTTGSSAVPVHVPGSGTSGTTGSTPLPGVARPTSDTRALVVPLDAFAKRGGPDVSVKTDAGILRVHAVFQMDPSTKEMSVSIVDEAGRLVRMIPPESVARMIAAMAAYRGR
ncbi:MAG: flagellar protein FlaG [Chloroflexota bacterium]